MSKKKAFSGSTMTLKDFHGGSIPSPLQLPSAPGMTMERSGHDRPNSGGWMGSSLNRGYGGERGGFLKQGSANGARSFEDKALYFPNPANIGRNYDEDERKPVDGHNRRGQGVESFEDQTYEQRRSAYDRPSDRYSLDSRGSFNSSNYLDSRSDSYVHEEFGLIPVGPPPKTQSQAYQQYVQAASTYVQDALPPVPQSQDHAAYFQSQQLRSGSHYGSQQFQDTASPWRQNTGSVQQPAASGTNTPSGSGLQNVWTARREGELNRSYSAELSNTDSLGIVRAQAAASRIAQASAVEKVSSGRWNSRISPPAIDQAHQNAGEYFPPESRSYDGGRGSNLGIESTNEEVQARYAPDVGHAGHNDTPRSSFYEYTRAAYTETDRGIQSVPSRASYTNVGQGNFPDARRERYGEMRVNNLSDSSNVADGSIKYLESGRGSLSDPELGRYPEENSGHGYGEIGRRVNAGHRDSAWPVGNERGMHGEPNRTTGLREPARFGGNEASAYVEPVQTVGLRDSARFGGNEAGTYVEPGNSAQSNRWMGVGAPTRGEFVDGRIGIYGDAERGAVSDSGRRGIGKIDSRMDVETEAISYNRNDTTGLSHLEARRGTHPEGVCGVFGYEDIGQQTHGYMPGRDFFPTESSKAMYVPDGPKGAYANEKIKGAYAVDINHGLPMEGGRLQTPRGARLSIVGETGAPASAVPPSILESEGKSIPSERPKLRLLPRTKPLDVEYMDSFAQEGPGDVQGDPEGSQSISTSTSELPSAVVPMWAATSATAGLGTDEKGDESNRPSERPKLNLKPRSQTVDVVSDRGPFKERINVFGGARPRELVLKERGVDESVIVGVDPVPSPGALISGLRPTSGGNRDLEYRTEKQEKVEEQKLDGRRVEQEGGLVRQMERHDSGRYERSGSRGRKEGWFDQDKKDDRRVMERSDSWHIQERKESDRPDVDKQDTWRRPVESTGGPRSPISVAGTGELSSLGSGRLGVSSAVELAQAFSRSTSIGSGGGGAARGYSSQRAPMLRSPGPGFGFGYESPGVYGTSPKDVPFSRLTDAPSPGPRDVYASGAHSGYRRSNGF